MHLLVSGRLVVVFVIVSMTPRSAASVSFLDSLFLLGCSWLSGKACACCLEEVSVSGHGLPRSARLMSLLVAGKKSLSLGYWVPCYSLGFSGSAKTRLSIQPPGCR